MEFIHFILEAVWKRYVVILEVAILYFCRQSNLKLIKLALALTRKQCWLKLIEQVKDFKSFGGTGTDKETVLVKADRAG